MLVRKELAEFKKGQEKKESESSAGSSKKAGKSNEDSHDSQEEACESEKNLKKDDLKPMKPAELLKEEKWDTIITELSKFNMSSNLKSMSLIRIIIRSARNKKGCGKI